MAFSKKYISILFVILALPLCFQIAQADALTTDYCGAGAAEPPFLAYGVDPNLLLLIDNSGSTLDLGYVETDSHCFDDTYDVNTTYAGYFDHLSYYVYNVLAASASEEKFIKWSDASDTEKNTLWNNVSYDEYYYDDSDPIAEIKIDTSSSAVTGFKAWGNFLNWATASKIDIQKEILTGGKHDATNNLLVMESRGCLDRRHVKQVALDYTHHDSESATAATNYFTIATRPPEMPTYDDWATDTVYSTGDIVDDLGVLYIATCPSNPCTSTGVGVADDTGVTWSQYSPWTNNTVYPAGSIVTDASKANSIDAGTLYYTTNGGTASGATGVDDDTGVTDWEPYNLTHIELFPPDDSGFDVSGCEDAVASMDDPTGQGAVTQGVNDCMGYTAGQGSLVTNSHAAFNHAIHVCWFWGKQGSWPTQMDSNTTQKCEDIYNAPIDPWNITPSDRAYVCYGSYPDDDGNFLGYIGRCWNPGEGAEYGCPEEEYFTGGPNADTCKKPGWVGGTSPGWDTAGYDSVQICVETAMQEFCGSFTVPEVIDPSDEVRRRASERTQRTDRSVFSPHRAHPGI